MNYYNKKEKLLKEIKESMDKEFIHIFIKDLIEEYEVSADKLFNTIPLNFFCEVCDKELKAELYENDVYIIPCDHKEK